MHEVDRERVHVVLNLLGESIGEPSKATDAKFPAHHGLVSGEVSLPTLA